MIVYLIFQIMTISRRKKGHTSQVHMLPDHLDQVRHHIHRNLGDAIETKAGQLIANGTIPETLYQRSFIYVQIRIAGSGNIRGDILIHKDAQVTAETPVTHGIVYLPVTR